MTETLQATNGWSVRITATFPKPSQNHVLASFPTFAEATAYKRQCDDLGMSFTEFTIEPK